MYKYACTIQILNIYTDMWIYIYTHIYLYINIYRYIKIKK